MKLPVIQGVIRRRILLNFRVDVDVMRRNIPGRFSPKLLNGQAVAGICLIRLEQIRPLAAPSAFGVASENAAHRVAVEWATKETRQEGVYIPRRDTNSPLVLMAGGRLFPGEHHKATFEVKDDGKAIDFSMRSIDGDVEVRVKGTSADALPETSRFATVAEASSFFEKGYLGYSATRKGDRLEGLELHTTAWRVEPLDVTEVYSSYFTDEARFPRGSIAFDCALIMRNIPHQWTTAPELYSLEIDRAVGMSS